MLLADVVRASNKVSGTSSRNSKVSLIADLLRQCAREVAEGTTPQDEIGLATRFLSGSLRQRRTGIALSSLLERSWSDLPEPSDAGIVTLTELDRVMQDSSDMAGAVELTEVRAGPWPPKESSPLSRKPFWWRVQARSVSST